MKRACFLLAQAYQLQVKTLEQRAFDESAGCVTTVTSKTSTDELLC